MAALQNPSDDALNESGVPKPVAFRVPRSIGGLFADAATLLNTNTYTQVIPVSGAGVVTLRGKFTCAGTLSFAYRRAPQHVETPYTLDAPHDDVAVVANTEFEVTDIQPNGEAYVAVTFTPSGAGAVTFFDVLQLPERNGLGPSESFIGDVGFGEFYGSAEITTPAGTPTYTAGDVVSNSAAATVFGEIDVARVAGGAVMIDDLRAATDQAACVAQLRMHLYDVPNASLSTPVVGDDVAFPDIYANGAHYRGYIDFLPFATGLAGSTAARSGVTNPQKRFQCAVGDTKLYFVLQTQTGFTRAAAQKISVYAGGVQLD